MAKTAPNHETSARSSLIRAAEKLFSAQGFHATSIRNLTQAANTNVSSINYHFGDKYRLYESILVEHFDEIRQEIEASKLYQKSPHEQLCLMNAMMQQILLSKGGITRMIYYALMSKDEKLRHITKTIMEHHIKPLVERLQFSSRKCQWKGAASKLNPDTFVFLIMAVNTYWSLFGKELHSLFSMTPKALLKDTFASISDILQNFTEEI